MSKKMLVSLVLLLALAGIASAAAQTAQWVNTVPLGAWEDSSNWSTGGTASLPPGTADFAAPYPPDGGFTAVTITLSSTQSVGRAKWQHNSATLNINNGGELINNGSVGSLQMYGGTSETININNGGALIAQGSGTGLQTGTGSHTINVQSGGLLGCYGTTSHLATSALGLGTTSAGAGTSTVNVYGTLDADSITLTNSNDVINLYVGGVIYVKGTLSGTITPVAGTLQTTPNVTDPTAGYDNGQTVTMYTTVPEPATIALLGLGGLLLRRKR